jgi:hypothetical protein
MKKQAVAIHSCDCANEYFFCEHNDAVFLHLLENGKPVQASKIRKIKTNKELQIFDHLSKEQQVRRN